MFACNYIFHDNCMPQRFENYSPQFLETGLQDCLKAQSGCWQELVTDIVILNNMHGPCHLRCVDSYIFIPECTMHPCTVCQVPICPSAASHSTPICQQHGGHAECPSFDLKAFSFVQETKSLQIRVLPVDGLIAILVVGKSGFHLASVELL